MVATRSPPALVDGGTREGANDVVPPDAVEECPDDPSTKLEPRDPTARPAPVDPDPATPTPKHGPPTEKAAAGVMSTSRQSTRSPRGRSASQYHPAKPPSIRRGGTPGSRLSNSAGGGRPQPLHHSSVSTISPLFTNGGTPDRRINSARFRCIRLPCRMARAFASSHPSG